MVVTHQEDGYLSKCCCLTFVFKVEMVVGKSKCISLHGLFFTGFQMACVCIICARPRRDVTPRANDICSYVTILGP